MRALAKLEQVLPHHLRRRVSALQEHTVALLPGGADAPTVPADTLAEIAAACRDRRLLRFAYRGHDGTESTREAEPYRLVHTGRRWYLMAWDRGRSDWRTFRVDRLTPKTGRGARFTPGRHPPPTSCRAGSTSRCPGSAPA